MGLIISEDSNNQKNDKVMEGSLILFKRLIPVLLAFILVFLLWLFFNHGVQSLKKEKNLEIETNSLDSNAANSNRFDSALYISKPKRGEILGMIIK
jgi:hypothetical protein